MAQPTPGPIVLFSDVEEAVRDTLQAWVPFYLADIDEQQERERGATLAPRTWDIASDAQQTWLDEEPPALIVACPTTIGDPERHGARASYAVTYQVNIGATAAAATETDGRAIAARFAGAVQYVIGQQGDMGGLAEASSWLGTRTDVIERRRDVIAIEVLASVHVRHVFDSRGHLIPRTPPANPTSTADPTPTVDGSVITTTRT